MESMIKPDPQPPIPSTLIPSRFPPIPSTLIPPRFPSKLNLNSGFLQMHKRQTRLHSLSSALFLAATTAPKSADISFLLPTSAVLFAMYCFANFVVPDLIMKDLQAKEDDGENTPDDGQEKRGFDDTK